MKMNLFHQPLRILPARAWRSYLGGRLIDEWQGNRPASDSNFPEEWIGSTVRARNPGREHLTHEGLNEVVLPDGSTAWLHDLVHADSVGMLGISLAGSRTFSEAQKQGQVASIPILVKILDAACRLCIQVHPDRTMARTVFNSDYGKTEAWYILGGRMVDGQPPHIYMGFREGLTRTQWEALYASQDVPGMLRVMHRIPVEPGQVYLVEGGVPHAIGAGCLLLEIQEPTDYTLRTERQTADGRWLSDEACSLGAGLTGLFDIFHYEPCSHAEALARWQLVPTILEQTPDLVRTRLIDRQRVPFFGLEQLDIQTRATDIGRDTFSILTVLSGSGTLMADHLELPIRQGQSWFVPAAAASVSAICRGPEPLRIAQSLPADAARIEVNP